MDALDSAFDALVTGPQGLALEGRLIPGLPDRTMHLDEVRALLGRSHRTATTTTGDAVWSHVLLRARTGDPAWRVAAGGLALPWLVGLSRDVATRYGGDRAEVAAEALAGFLDALDQTDPTEQCIAEHLRIAAHRAAVAATTSITVPAGTAGNLAAFADRFGKDPGQRFASAPPPVPYEHPDLVLIRAVADRVLTATDADLIGATRIDKTPIDAWAATNRVSVWTARQRRRRAEQALVGYLCDPDYHPLLVDAARLAHRPAAGRRRWCVCAAATSHAPAGRRLVGSRRCPPSPEEGSACA